MSALTDAGTPAPAERTATAPVSAPNDAGTPAPAERTAQVQEEAPGRAWHSRRTRGRARHDRRSWGRAWRNRDHRKRCRCAGKTCREMTDRKRWLNHRVSRKHRLQLRVRRRCGGGGVGEIRLVKHDVSGDQDAARGEIKASIPLVVRGVTKKHTTSRAGRQLVRSSGGGVRVTRTPEDPNVVVARRGTEKSVMWSGSRRSSGRKTVK